MHAAVVIIAAVAVVAVAGMIAFSLATDIVIAVAFAAVDVMEGSCDGRGICEPLLTAVGSIDIDIQCIMGAMSYVRVLVLYVSPVLYFQIRSCFFNGFSKPFKGLFQSPSKGS